MAQPNLASLLAPGARARNLDLNALLAIASHEGAGGGIGDGGHAFGPFQLNNAGGVLTGKFRGMSPQQINQWAWSPAGIAFAEDRIAQVAGGERGPQAVKDIATKFERPANVGAEIQDALAHYGGPQASSTVPSRTLMSVGAPTPSSSAPTGNFGSLLGGLIGETNQSLGLGSGQPLPLVDLFKANAAWGTPAGPKVGGKAGVGQAGLPKPGGKMTALDGITIDSKVAPEVQQVLKLFPGLRPTSGYRSPTHNAQVGGAENSDHLRGDAVDFGGNPQALAALYRYAQGRYPYVEPMAQAKNHVHISFARSG